MGYAFISYSSKDQQMADSFRTFFNQNGITTWMAPGDIPFGATYTSTINRAIKDSSCFVLLLSDSAQRSKWVPKETERAVNYEKTIIPVLLDDVPMNDEFEFMLSSSQAVAIRKIDESDEKIKRLLKTIKTYTDDEKQETEKSPVEPTEKEQNKSAPDTADAKMTVPAPEEPPKNVSASKVPVRDTGFSDCKVGDIVEFGRYPQTADGEEKPIDWIVLDRDGDKTLLISKYGLDCQPYNYKNEQVDWETCTLRKWLNSEFADRAFDPDERDCIVVGTVLADKNPEYETDPGKDTKDGVFLLSIHEAQNCFSSRDDSRCQGTAYCYARGASRARNGNCWWWLRSPGDTQGYAAGVYSDGDVDDGGSYVLSVNRAVRPALWINLKS